MSHAGFCVGGYLWSGLTPLPGVSRQEDLANRRRAAADDVRLTRELGGDMLRSFWLMEHLFTGEREGLAAALNTLTDAQLNNDSVFLLAAEDRIARLDQADVALDHLLRVVAAEASDSFGLDLEGIDAALAGVEEANRESSQPVHLLLTLVSPPPRLIIEAPPDSVLHAHGRRYTFSSLWNRYLRLHQEVHRMLVRRFAAGRPLSGVRALEIINEPDYVWVPQEMKIEFGAPALINPVWKYVTELHLPQVPEADSPAQPFEPAPWGFGPQAGPWSAEGGHEQTPVLEFDWGVKFDWYVKCCAQLMAHVAWAIKDEAAARSVELTTVSGSVTHNNIDYLLRLRRAEKEVFDWIDKIGVHPYHWVRNDVWDAEFVGSTPIEGWSKDDPRRFAESDFKRFDFLRAFAGESGDTRLDLEIQETFGGRELWITEFGIGSKVLGAFNSEVADTTKFIRPRALVGGTAGYDDIVWEDLWGAFLDQVDEHWLRTHNVGSLLLYALREMQIPGSDVDDDDRSNLALLHHDGSPRLDPPMLDRVSRLVRSMSSDGTGPGTGAAGPEKASAAGLDPPSPSDVSQLYRRAWRSVVLPAPAADVMTMLSVEERQLLYWLTASRYEGAGAIVDGGCFVGGSTIALAEGLRAAGRRGPIDVYDLFEVETYMTDFYFRGSELVAGDSFRPVFDENTAHVRDLLDVHQGDLTVEGWRGDPIEILFIDFAKGWSLNDFIVSSFFPSLIPGRSIVIQQDFVFAGCPWVILTMEHLHEYFVPLAFAEYSSVVYLCTRAVPADLPPISALPHEARMVLMDRCIGRFRGYAREVLLCAKAALLVDSNERHPAKLIIDDVEWRNGSDPVIGPAISLVRALL